MNSQLNEEFRARFAKLPEHIKALTRKNYRLWKENPAHPGLGFKKVVRDPPIYSVRIGLGWRTLGLLEGDTITWFWIGPHAEYDRRITQF